MCIEERPCISCYTDNGLCEDKLNSFLKEATELSYKYGLKFCDQKPNGVIKVCEIDENKGEYTEVINGSGLVEF